MSVEEDRREAVDRLIQAYEAKKSSAERLERARIAREEAILQAYEAGMPIGEIQEITGLSQPNIARARRRAKERR